MLALEADEGPLGGPWTGSRDGEQEVERGDDLMKRLRTLSDGVRLDQGVLPRPAR